MRRVARAWFAALMLLSLTAGLAEARDVRTGNRTHYVPSRGSAKPAGSHSRSPDMTYHGGPIMVTGVVQSIFWGTSWGNAGFVGDKLTGLDSFYSGIGGTAYAATNNEYTGSNGRVSGSVAFGGHFIDLSPAPSRPPSASAVLNEVARQITSPVSNGYYPVYVDTRRGNAGYCAWHSAGTIGGVTVQFAFFFNLDGDPGCDPRDTWTANSQGLAALANVTGHELSEALTDPHIDAWYDTSGAENADKCAWTFHQVVSFGTTSWKIQGNWSNRAYDNGRVGYANGGCIDGN